MPVIGSSHTVCADQAGYLQGVDLETLASLAERLDGVIHLRFRFGDHVVENQPILVLEADEKPAEGWGEQARHALVYMDGESIEKCFSHGMSQLMEIAVKALSPGISERLNLGDHRLVLPATLPDQDAGGSRSPPRHQRHQRHHEQDQE